MLGGKLLGSFLGGPIGGAIGGLAGGLIGSLLFNRSKPLVPDAQIGTSAYGNFIPILYGSGRFAATTIWNTDINVKKHGAGIGKGQSTSSYDQSAAFAFCRGPARLLKIWLDGKLFYDATSENPVELTKYQFFMRAYSGTEDQQADPLIAMWVGTHVVPSLSVPTYRGLAYLLFQQVDLSHFGNRMPNVTASWATDYQEKIISTRLTFWQDDVSASTSEAGGLGQGSGVDWVSFRLYWVTADGAVRVFDLMSGQCINAVTFTELWSGFGAGVPTWLADMTFPVSAAGVCQGGNLYIVTPAVGANPSAVLTVDPNTLRVINNMPNRKLPGVNGMVPLQVVSLQEERPTDLLVLKDFFGYVSIINPQSGLQSDRYSVGRSGIDTTTVAVVGKQDTSLGIVEVWFLNSNFLFGPSDDLYISRVILGSDPSGAEAFTVSEATLHCSDFGVTVVHGSAMQAINGVYDAADDTLIISVGNVALGDYTGAAGTFPSRAIKWSPDFGVVWIAPKAAVWSNSTASYYSTESGIVGDGMSSNQYYVSQASSGRIEGPYTSDPYLPTHFILGYNSHLNALVAYAGSGGAFGTLYVIYLQRAAARDTPVAAIIQDLCNKAGLAPESVDVSGVTATTVGYSITEEKSFGAAISDLCHVFQIDMTESDYKLKFTQRGSSPVARITQQDLAPADADPSHYWEQTRALEQEMPLQINVKYVDPELDYQPGASYAKRIALPVPTVFSRRIKSIDLPVAARNVDARHIAESWLYTMWAERDIYKTALAQKYLYLDPTDNITVVLDNGDEIVARITTTDIGDDYSLKLELSSEDETTYEASSSPGALISFVPQIITQSGFVDLLQFNVPLLQDSDDLGGSQMRVYWAGGPTAPLASSASATLYESIDGSAWPVFGQADMFADWGTLVSSLGSTIAAFSTDYENTLTFKLALGSTSPVSCTYWDMMSGANPALVGSEIIQYQNAVENPDGTYTLSTLLRGRRGTEWAIGTHQTGERIIFLTFGEIQPGRMPLSLRGQTTLWKLVPAGRFIDSTPADSFAYRGYDLMPYAPVNAERTLSGSNLVISWIRRTRMGGLLVDGTDTAPLNEESEIYEVYLLDSAADLANFDPTVSATYRRAYLGLTSPTASYLAAHMAADGFDLTTGTIYAVIYQISAAVGRGFPGFHVLPAPGGGLTVGLEDGSGNWAGWTWG